MQNFIDTASNVPVINGAIKIKTDFLSTKSLMDPNSQMTKDPVSAVNNHFKRGRAKFSLKQDDITSYLASSSLLHTLDSWTYLSHAVESLLKGDDGVAIHLAYYSELRSSMSFLASEGVGIFDHFHLNVDSSNQTNEDPGITYYDQRKRRNVNRKGGTHEMVWEAMSKWSSSIKKPISSDILQVFSVNGRTFEDWVAAFPFPSPVNGALIIKKWIKEWSFDIRFFKHDRKMRNEVSYRPQRLNNVPPKHSINEIIQELSSYWNILEPYQSNTFQVLDKYLLRILLQKMYHNLSKEVKRSNSLEGVIIDTFNNLGETQNQSFIDFLKDETTTHPIFVEAKNHALDPTTKSLNAISVIARATLMLRISTGNTSLVYRKAGVSKPELDFLWERYGVENGFWNSSDAPADFNDLWDDIRDHVEEITDWADEKKPNLSLSQVYEDPDIPFAFNYFKQFNRVGLWGLAI